MNNMIIAPNYKILDNTVLQPLPEYVENDISGVSQRIKPQLPGAIHCTRGANPSVFGLLASRGFVKYGSY